MGTYEKKGKDYYIIMCTGYAIAIHCTNNDDLNLRSILIMVNISILFYTIYLIYKKMRNKEDANDINTGNAKRYLGIVVPKMESLSNMDLAKLQSKCANVMNSSTIFHAILLLIFGILYKQTDSIHALLAFTINFFMLCQGVDESQWAYGDIAAYGKIKKNEIDFYLYLAFVINEDDEATEEDIVF